jgi:putative hemolysin
MAVKNDDEYLTSALKALVFVSIQEFPLSQSLSSVSQNFMRAGRQVGKPYA